MCGDCLDRYYVGGRGTPPTPTSDDALVTVKLDRDVVARLAALKVTYGRRSYSEVIRDLLRIK